MQTNQKKKKWRKWLVLGVVVVILAGAASFSLLRPETEQYQTESAKNGNLTTYYSFTGEIYAEDSAEVKAPQTLIVDSLYVKEGDKVKEEQQLLRSQSGITLKAPIDGTVYALDIEAEDKLQPGEVVMEIVDTDSLYVNISVDEQDIFAVKKDKEVTVYVNALDREIKGTVDKVGRRATAVGGISYFPAVISLEKRDDVLLGMTCEVRLIAKDVQNAVLLPMKAIQFDDDDQPFVYVSDDGRKLITRLIRVGESDGTYAEITYGLKDGETVYMTKKTARDSLMSFGGR